MKIDTYFNCYDKYIYYYYFDNIIKKYICTNEDKCPEGYNELIEDKNECIDDCRKYNEYKYELGNKCLKICPENFEVVNGFLCELHCNKDSPFELVNEQKCIINSRII